MLFRSVSVNRPTYLRSAMFHLAAPLVALGLFWLFVDDLRQLDWLISASYLFYLLALARLWRRGADGLIYARVETSQKLADWMLRLIGLLLFILGMDSVIALDFALHQGANVPWLISYGTIPLLLILLIILLTIPRLVSLPRQKLEVPAAELGQDQNIIANLTSLMNTEKLYLDQEITVQRLAKRLHLPTKALSGAVNRTQGKNISQFVNDLRLAHAANLLKQSPDSITAIAAQSGFLTRSNFYREFQRVYGQSPSQFRATNVNDASNRPSDAG